MSDLTKAKEDFYKQTIRHVSDLATAHAKFSTETIRLLEQVFKTLHSLRDYGIKYKTPSYVEGIVDALELVADARFYVHQHLNQEDES